MQVFLIRHPRPRIAEGICYGQLDVPALDLVSTADALRAQLPPGLPVIASPLARCRELATLLHPAPRFDARLMEMHFGEWEGKPWDEIPREALDAWAADVPHFAPPGGESAAMLQSRCVAVLDALVQEDATACAVVTHAGIMRAAVGHLRREPAAVWSQRRFAHGEYVLIDWPAS